MRRHRLLVVAVVVTLAAPGRGFTQFQQPLRGPSGPPTSASRPAFSPYLNLLRRDASPGVNYYGLVRPQLATQQSLQGLQQQIVTVQQQEAAVGGVDPSLPVTGQPVYFLNTGGYFLNQRVGPATANRATVQSPRPVNPGRSMAAPGRTR